EHTHIPDPPPHRHLHTGSHTTHVSNLGVHNGLQLAPAGLHGPSHRHTLSREPLHPQDRLMQQRLQRTAVRRHTHQSVRNQLAPRVVVKPLLGERLTHIRHRRHRSRPLSGHHHRHHTSQIPR